MFIIPISGYDGVVTLEASGYYLKMTIPDEARENGFIEFDKDELEEIINALQTLNEQVKR